ncbi:SDR family NAD(P)-dependent oxidoreductase [Alteromonas flava]|uniref:SDR family NAD(P)-dependent oxidoreductase n=1 Tax=Alteromonas flava TaxID=2048003 RepID=UPI000C28E132|nr:SDR family NAD(P)-dependent oxidoreductase [Alteromonas flava]
MSSNQQRILIIGGSSGIAQALIEHHLSEPVVERVYVVSRGSQDFFQDSSKLVWVSCDTGNEAQVKELIAEWQAEDVRFNRVISTVGMLHTPDVQPEKKLEDLNIDTFTQVISVNTGINALWLKFAAQLLEQTTRSEWVVFSARVGSINDNQLGGWYSYRASKAALNMLMKTASIEFARRFKKAKLVCYHPGTVDTPLSKPFQANVKPNKLFTPDFTASQLIKHLQSLPDNNNLAYIDWDGKSIPW